MKHKELGMELTHLHSSNCVLFVNNQKLIVLNILSLLRLVRSDMVDIMRVLEDRKNGDFGVKLIIFCDFKKKFIIVDIQEWMINNVGRCSLETMIINGNTWKQVISKKKTT